MPLTHRPRRLRQSATLRRMVQETRLTPDDFIYPLFITHGEGVRQPISSMPGIAQLSVDEAVREAARAQALGIPAVLLFGIPAHKDEIGSENFAPDGIMPQALRALKAALPELLLITDVCLCEYTAHGHCGVLDDHGRVLNDETLPLLVQTALAHARAGADIVAPSGMMDGMVAALRTGLDEAGFTHLPLMSYAIKYASAFYGPFREAAQGAPQFGDRKTHQMNPANSREALREAALDVAEGADFLMVKPALAYLDILRQTREQFPEMPLVGYNVSGEYAMLKGAAERGWLDERTAVLETLTSIKRAGADLIITYHALEAAAWLRGN
jgi:porphobilinogen synthase